MGRKAILRPKQLKCRSSRCGGRAVALGFCKPCYKRYREVLSKLQKLNPERAARLVAVVKRQNFLRPEKDILKTRVRHQLMAFEQTPAPPKKPRSVAFRWIKNES